MEWNSGDRRSSRRRRADGSAGRYRVDFVLDRRLRRYRWSWRTEPKLDAPTPSSGGAADCLAGMLKDHTLYRMSRPYSPAGQIARDPNRTVELSDPPTGSNPLAVGDFDAVYFLTAGGVRLADVFLQRSDFIEGLDRRQPRRVIDEGDATTGAGQLADATFSADRAGAAGIVRLRQQRSDRVESWMLDLETRAGALTPRRIQIDVLDEAGRVQRQRTIHFETSVVNRRIPRDAWTLEQLGARPGDLIRDVRAGVQYVYSGGADFRTPGASPAGESGSTLYYVAINLSAWVVALLFAAVIGRWRQTRTSASQQAL